MTEPTVLRGREISTVWLGLSGAWTWRGAAGARPKLGREKPPMGMARGAGPSDPRDGAAAATSLSNEPASPQAQAQARKTDSYPYPPPLHGHMDRRTEPQAGCGLCLTGLGAGQTRVSTAFACPSESAL